ncbi:MAG TPA: DUF1861 family protein [Tepidisphaeraceae bacterium]|jgi:hypothetical protein|nr:DUF1861 family protein [Tepidisphaeraceae bacterium]
MSITTETNGPVVRREIPHAGAVSCRELLHHFTTGNGHLMESGKLQFLDVNGCDVYNTTAPFEHDGKTLIAGRVEPRETELATVVFFSRRADGAWEPCPSAIRLPGLQDPCVTKVAGELVVGGVRSPVDLSDGRRTYRMEFYRGSDLSDLRPFLVGPTGMKDIRLVELPDGRIAVFSRPQGAVGGRGKIGFTVVAGLSAITADVIASAPLFPGQFLDEEWGGANEIHVLSNGKLGVLGHIARFDELQHRHYYGMVFSVDAAGVATPPRIIAERKMFPAGPAKRADLVDVIFSGGLTRNGDGTATLFAGISDVETAYLHIPDPFVEFEA